MVWREMQMMYWTTPKYIQVADPANCEWKDICRIIKDTDCVAGDILNIPRPQVSIIPRGSGHDKCNGDRLQIYRAARRRCKTALQDGAARRDAALSQCCYIK